MSVTIHHGDCRTILPTLDAGSVQCCVTSPPYYGLRDYGVGGQLGLEPTPDEYVAEMVAVFREVRRVLRDDGTLWLNIGDSYAAGGNGGGAPGSKQTTNVGALIGRKTAPIGYKPKDLLGIPWLLAFALRADGWYLRSDIIWHKPNCMPESIKDRPTSAHEHVFLLTKRPSYYYDADAIREPHTSDAEGVNNPASRAALPHDAGKQFVDGGLRRPPSRPADYFGHALGRNARNVWSIPTQPFSGTTKTVHRVPVAWDAPDDGKTRIASPDCPIHGDRADPAATASCGAHAGDPTHHNGSTGTRHAQAQPSGCEPIGQLFEQATAACSSGSPLLACSLSASSHSSQTSRTAPALGTSAPCKPCAQKHSGTARTSEVSVSSAPCGCTPESNTTSDEMACNASHQTGFGTGDTQSEPAISSASDPHTCTCEYYIERAEKTSHFATMPPGLAERCIKAGTSEKGACPHCGAPWGRVTERAPVEQTGVTPKQAQYRAQGLASSKSTIGRTKAWSADEGRVETLGWAPSCVCPSHQPVPCMVLDPFGGAGTTGLVADRLNRSAVLIELNPEYRTLAAERISCDAPLFGAVA